MLAQLRGNRLQNTDGPPKEAFLLSRAMKEKEEDQTEEDISLTQGRSTTLKMMIADQRQRRRRLTATQRQRTSLPATAVLPLLLLQLLATCFTAKAWVPPKYNPESWESVHAMRERLGIQYNYTPTLVHPEICRYMSEQECQQGDENLRKHAKAHRALSQNHNPNLGTFKVLVLLIVFEDHVNRPRIDKSDVEYTWNTLIPEWFDVNSHGNYDVEPVVAEWVVTDNTELYYSHGRSGQVPEFQKAAWPALDALDNTPGWDWSVFDLNGDNLLDSVVITHSGYGAETQRADEYGRANTDRIWAHAFADAGSETWTSRDGSISLNGYTVTSALEDATGTVPATIGITVHEYMHTFDIIDLYDISQEGKGISGFDIMANPYGSGDGNLPGHLSTWTKMEAEWITPTEITHDGVYVLQPLETSSDGYEIELGYGFSGKEYLLLENRQQLEFDVDLYGAGLAIYHVDDGKRDQSQGGHPGQSGWPQNGNHYKVAMLQADGNYDMEMGSRGDSGDLWQPGQSLGPGNDNTVFPNTDMYSDGWIFETGITVTVLENAGQNVRFEVSGLAPGPAPTASEGNANGNQNGDSNSGSPSLLPSLSPSDFPSEKPSLRLSSNPTTSEGNANGNQNGNGNSGSPSLLPSLSLSEIPSEKPSLRLSGSPTTSDLGAPSAALSSGPQEPPLTSPALSPSQTPSGLPSLQASESPSAALSSGPQEPPLTSPALSPSQTPSGLPSLQASESPSNLPTSGLSATPSVTPSALPSDLPTSGLSATPSVLPSDAPTSGPTGAPSKSPSLAPSTNGPTVTPGKPSRPPTPTPTKVPTISPSAMPTAGPTIVPSSVPSVALSVTPSVAPSGSTESPSCAPSSGPGKACVTTRAPREFPSVSQAPTVASSGTPSESPTYNVPTQQPRESPSVSQAPSTVASTPSESPTYNVPTQQPTHFFGMTGSSQLFSAVMKETPEPTPVFGITHAEAPTGSIQVFSTVVKETPEPTPSPVTVSTTRPNYAPHSGAEVTPRPTVAQDNAIGNLLQPAEEHGVVAADFDNSQPTLEPFSVSVQMSDNRPPTPEAFSVSVQMSSHARDNPLEIVDSSNLDSPETSGSSSISSWFSMMGTISLVLLISLLEFN